MLADKINNYFEKMLIDEHYRTKIQVISSSFLFGAINTIMFAINIATITVNLMIVTGISMIFSFIAAYISIKLKKIKLASYLMSSVILIEFSSFLFDGGVDGFSTIWIMLMPYVSLCFWGLKQGSVVSITMFIIILLVFHTPIINLVTYDFSDTFILRFPIAYFSSFLFAFVSEFLRFKTYSKLKQSRTELEKLSMIDGLTKLENRRSFDMKYLKAWEEAKSFKSQIGLIMIDIDYFKNYNDNYGHLEGDNVLISISNAIQKSIYGKNFTAARWGGEEFIILMTNVSKKEVFNLSKHILKMVLDLNISHMYSMLDKKTVTVSIGQAIICPSNKILPEQFIELADKSLYSAKKNGRNKIGECFGSDKTILE